MEKAYQICTRCIMDTTDPDIEFDEKGECNHCRNYRNNANYLPWDEAEKEGQLQEIIEEIKAKGRDKRYDCIIGVSGGVDSTFVAYKVKEFGLRPLAVHLDNGWDSELAVSNIEKVLKTLDIDLFTYVIDWEEFKDLQLSFLRASTPDSEIPSDHGIYAILYKVAAKEGVKFIVTGGNVSTEGIMPMTWSSGHRDWRYIKNVHKKFGKAKLKSYPRYTLPGRLYYNFLKRIKVIRILDYMIYNKKEAMEVLEKKLGWKNYGGKHYESVYTRFYQAYILPRKFNMDKRKGHLSTLICSGQITRDEALAEMKKEIFPADKLREDKQFVIKKLGLTEEEFEEIMVLPARSYTDYPTYGNHPLYKMVRPLYFRLRNLVVYGK